jgi:phage FluMu gp28-like protein
MIKVFFWGIIKRVLYPYQVSWIEDDSRLKIGKFARQTGKTFGTTLEIVDNVFAAEADGYRSNWVTLSRGERQSKELLDEGVKKHLNARGMYLETLEYEFSDDCSIKALEVITPFGSKITALPANPDTARGFSRNVYLDEFAFHQDSKKIWGALYPVVSRPDLLLRITSTPNGKDNMFYQIMENPEGKFRNWSRHIVDIYEAVRQGLPYNIDELRDGLGDDDLWAQEFELDWLDESSAWLSYELIASCEHDSAGDPALFQSKRPKVFLGLDLALKSDLWVLTVSELVGDVLWIRDLIVRKRPSIDERDSLVEECFTKYSVARLCIDETGLGQDVTERYQKAYGEERVEGVTFSMPSKLVLANSIKDRFQKRNYRIPVDSLLKKDLHSVRKSFTPTGGMRLDATKSVDGHADRFWSLALCSYAADNGGGPITVSVKTEPEWLKQTDRYGGYKAGTRRLSAARGRY